ncbi:MAG TPA: aminodeoxychorismate/anthranilate synthase component II [Longimicrobiaceae bacterium]
MILVIDNYDSFTWNLVQYLGELGAEMEVRRNDELSVDEIERMAPERIVISPGPCTPNEAGVSVDVIRRLGPATPILGVCLGHQSIGAAYGGDVVRADRVMHGKTSPIRHTGAGIFAGVPSPLTVARYHSLVIEPSTLPAELEAVAWTDEPGFETEIQAVRHREHPVWGVQFHPESIASEAGRDILRNFLELG